MIPKGTCKYLAVVTLERLMILDYLKQKGWTRFGDVWKSGIICKGSCDGILKTLEKQEFVKRKETSKYNNVTYNITAQGKQYIKAFEHLA